ncbi:FHA domain-containing protein [Roseateles sp. YR242]|uniref:FHA domain-containing protein n=1 Tax=Roseateles sp. YR242 TaxID=1855305 RepID=UPI001160BE19|nr:FHA domain-containing protein [Roseateles sp. YR242]
MQLRVLSGLHREAVLDLDEALDELVVGPAQDADIALVDPGLSGRHCRIVRQGGLWLIEPLEGAVLDVRRQPIAGAVPLMRGVPVGLGDIWIVLQAAEDDWAEVPPLKRPGKVPADGPAAAGAIRTQKRARAAAPQPATSPAGTTALRTAYPGMNSRLAAGVFAIALVPLAAWFVSAAWGSAAPRPSTPAGDLVPALAAVAASGAQAAAAALSSAELAEEFTHGLAERELTDRLDLKFDEDRWSIRGSLDPEEQQRFERFLMRFMDQRKPEFGIEVALLPLAELLPFKVIEIINGKEATVVTDAGDRIAVGDVVQGYRLASVEVGKAIFTGKRRIEVTL